MYKHYIMLIIIIIMYKCAAFLLGLQQESFWIHSEQLRYVLLTGEGDREMRC